MTTDADAYQRLTEALDAHRGDAAAYRRLGEQMAARRHLLGLRYGNRRLFVRERLLPLGLKEAAAYKLAYDLESGKLQSRGGYSPGNMLALASGYAVTPESVASVLDDDGDLVPVAALLPAVQPAAVPPESVATALARLDQDVAARAPSYVTGILVRRGDWRTAYAAAHPGIALTDVPEPSGADLFEPGSQDARSWDLHAAEFDDAEELAWLVASLQARRAAVRERESGAG